MQIDLHSKDSGIKMMLKNLIKQEFSIEELKASMAKKIAEEKDIIAKLEQFEIEAKNMPGEII
jgi:hypothetical protein